MSPVQVGRTIVSLLLLNIDQTVPAVHQPWLIVSLKVLFIVVVNSSTTLYIWSKIDS